MAVTYINSFIDILVTVKTQLFILIFNSIVVFPMYICSVHGNVNVASKLTVHV